MYVSRFLYNNMYLGTPVNIYLFVYRHIDLSSNLLYISICVCVCVCVCVCIQCVCVYVSVLFVKMNQTTATRNFPVVLATTFSSQINATFISEQKTPSITLSQMPQETTPIMNAG